MKFLRQNSNYIKKIQSKHQQQKFRPAVIIIIMNNKSFIFLSHILICLIQWLFSKSITGSHPFGHDLLLHRYYVVAVNAFFVLSQVVNIYKYQWAKFATKQISHVTTLVPFEMFFCFELLGTIGTFFKMMLAIVSKHMPLQGVDTTELL